MYLRSAFTSAERVFLCLYFCMSEYRHVCDAHCFFFMRVQ